MINQQLLTDGRVFQLANGWKLQYLLSNSALHYELTDGSGKQRIFYEWSNPEQSVDALVDMVGRLSVALGYELARTLAEANSTETSQEKVLEEDGSSP